MASQHLEDTRRLSLTVDCAIYLSCTKLILNAPPPIEARKVLFAGVFLSLLSLLKVLALAPAQAFAHALAASLALAPAPALALAVAPADPPAFALAFAFALTPALALSFAVLLLLPRTPLMQIRF